MMRLGLLDRDVQFGRNSDDVDPLGLLEHRDRRRRCFVERVRCHFHRVTDAALTREADDARPNGHAGQSISRGEQKAKTRRL